MNMAKNTTRSERAGIIVRTITCAALAAIMLLSLATGCRNRTDGSGTVIDRPTEVLTTSTQAAEKTPDATPTPAPTELPEELFIDNVYPLSEHIKSFKVYGRHEVKEKGVTCDWSGSGFAFRAAFEGDVYLETTVPGECYLTVFLDGERQADVIKASKNTQILKNVPRGSHLVEVFRQSEIRQCLLMLKTVKMHGTLLERPADNQLYFEFVGDSITSGYGTNAKADAGTNTDATMGYPFLLSRSMNADHSIVSITGIGMVKGYVNETMPDVYKMLDRYRSAKTAFEPVRVPDAVFVNLGTNDATMSSDPAKYIEAVKTLIGEIRAFYGNDVPVVWVYNSMRVDHSSHTLQALSELGGEAAKLYSFKMEMDSSSFGHPSANAHKRDAEALRAFIQTLPGIVP